MLVYVVVTNHTRFLVPVAALTCFHWYGLSLNYSVNNLGIKVSAINKRRLSLNARLVLTPGLQGPEGNKRPGIYSWKYGMQLMLIRLYYIVAVHLSHTLEADSYNMQGTYVYHVSICNRDSVFIWVFLTK